MPGWFVLVTYMSMLLRYVSHTHAKLSMHTYTHTNRSRKQPLLFWSAVCRETKAWACHLQCIHTPTKRDRQRVEKKKRNIAPTERACVWKHGSSRERTTRVCRVARTHHTKHMTASVQFVYHRQNQFVISRRRWRHATHFTAQSIFLLFLFSVVSFYSCFEFGFCVCFWLCE